MHVHPVPHLLMPNPHYHTCRPGKRACVFDCKRCGLLVSEAGHPPKSHFQLGCCHRCQDYKTCNDPVARHLVTAQGLVKERPAAAPPVAVTVAASAASEPVQGATAEPVAPRA